MNNQRSFLELKVIWKDNEMVELRIFATNGRYTGTTEVYDADSSLSEFSKSLMGFPKGNNTLIHQAGQKDNYAFFEISLYSIDGAGHISAQIELEDSVQTQYGQESKSKIKLEIIVEPNDIDNFQKELARLVTKREGTATLYGD